MTRIEEIEAVGEGIAALRSALNAERMITAWCEARGIAKPTQGQRIQALEASIAAVAASLSPGELS